MIVSRTRGGRRKSKVTPFLGNYSSHVVQGKGKKGRENNSLLEGERGEERGGGKKKRRITATPMPLAVRRC